MPWPWPGSRTRPPPPFPAFEERLRVAATRPLPRGRTLNRSGGRTPARRAARSTAIPAGRTAPRRPSARLPGASGRSSSLLVGVVAFVPDLRVVGENRLVLLEARLLAQLIEPRLVQLVLLLHLETLAQIGLLRVGHPGRVGALARLDREGVGGISLVDGRGRSVAGLRERENAFRKPGNEADAGNISAHRMERLGGLRLRSEEGRHIELARLLFLRRV